MKPEQRVIKLQHKCHILTGSGEKKAVRHTTNNTNIVYGGSDENYEDEDYDAYGAR